MAQHDYNVADAPGATVRADINALAEAIASLNAGASAPTTTFQLMVWYDLTNSLLKIRNVANSAWVSFASLLGITKADVGLGSVDNTADSTKPVSTAQAAADLIAQRETGSDNVQSGVTAYDFVLTDKGIAVIHDHTAAGTYTVPPASSVAFPVKKTTILLAAVNTGQMVIAAGAGVKILSEGGTTAGNDGKLKLSGFGAEASLKLIGADTWLLAGNLAA
jgi:hypothetical protein